MSIILYVLALNILLCVQLQVGILLISFDEVRYNMLSILRLYGYF